MFGLAQPGPLKHLQLCKLQICQGQAKPVFNKKGKEILIMRTKHKLKYD